MSGASCTSGATALADTVRAGAAFYMSHTYRENDEPMAHTSTGDPIYGATHITEGCPGCAASAALDALLALAVRAQDSAPGSLATPTQSGASPEGNDGEAGAEKTSQEAWGTDENGMLGTGYETSGAEDIAAVRHHLRSLWEAIDSHYRAARRSNLDPALAALDRLAIRLAEQDNYAGYGEIMEELTVRLAATEAEREEWTNETLLAIGREREAVKDEMEASEARAAKLEGALREILNYNPSSFPESATHRIAQAALESQQ